MVNIFLHSQSRLAHPYAKTSHRVSPAHAKAPRLGKPAALFAPPVDGVPADAKLSRRFGDGARAPHRNRENLRFDVLQCSDVAVVP